MKDLDLLQSDQQASRLAAAENRFFPVSCHLLALQKLEIAIRLRRGLSVLVGTAGTGKTVLCRQLLKVLSADRRVDAYFMAELDLSDPRALLIQLANLFSIPNPESLTEWQSKEAIKNGLFRKGVDEGRIQVLILDDGHLPDPACLEVLRELMNYETNDYKLLQIVMAGRPEMGMRLRAMPNLADRINLFLRLRPFDFRQACEMIDFQLQSLAAAGEAIVHFSRPAYRMAHWVSRGVPRAIADLCRDAVRAAGSENRRRVGWRQVLRLRRGAAGADLASGRPVAARAESSVAAKDQEWMEGVNPVEQTKTPGHPAS